MRRETTKGPLPTIRASELGEYSYCSRAWWYRHVIKIAPPPGSGTSSRLTRGVEAHRRHGRAVASASMLTRIGLALVLLGIAALFVALLIK